MADHLRLPPPVLLKTKRRSGGGGDIPVIDYGARATNLRGILEGLEGDYPGLFQASPPAGDESEDDVEDEPLDASNLGRIVLKFTGKGPFSGGPFTAMDMTPVGTNGQKDFYVLSNSAARTRLRDLSIAFAQNPDDYQAETKSLLAALVNIEGIEPYTRADRLAADLRRPEDGEVAIVEAVLWPTSIAELGVKKETILRLAEIRTLVQGAGAQDSRIKVLSADPRPDTMAIRAQVDPRTLDLLLDHPLVERVRSPMSVTVRGSDLDESPEPDSPVVVVGAPIGVVDDLVVTSNPWLNGVVVGSASFPAGHTFASRTSHGTQVAGIAAYGDLTPVLKGKPFPSPHPLYAARVLEGSTSGAAVAAGDLKRDLRDALRWLHDNGVKVVVLALGRATADSGALPSDVSATVDECARELDLAVVTAAGNLDDIAPMQWLKHYPTYLKSIDARVSEPGTAALSLTVGSTAHGGGVDLTRMPSGQAIAGAGHASPFTRTGPVPGGSGASRAKPELVGPGGNYVHDTATGNVSLDEPGTGVVVLTAPGLSRPFAISSGTSLAAPWVAHEMAQLATRYPEASANLLRALVCLSARSTPQLAGKKTSTIVSAYGYPAVDDVMESEGNKAIFVADAFIPTGAVSILELPIPREFSIGSSRRTFRVSLAFDPPVSRSRRDYIAGHIDMDFIRNRTLEEVETIYSLQPTAAELAANPRLIRVEKPRHGHDRPKLSPTMSSMKSSTVIVREYRTESGGWDADDENYFLVLEHVHSPWSQAQKNKYEWQSVAVAIQIVDENHADLDLHAAAAAKLGAMTANVRTRTRTRGRQR